MCYNLLVNLTLVQQNKLSKVLRASGAVIGYLFGSYVRGTAGVLSDIDVAVAFSVDMSKENQDNCVENIRAELEKTFGKDKVDVVNLNQINNPLLRYIILLGEGVQLFSEDTSLCSRLIMYARREYEDTAHLRMIQSQALSGLFV